ncbi:ABC subfamily C protein isoform X2 [Wolffia australiana]
MAAKVTVLSVSSSMAGGELLAISCGGQPRRLPFLRAHPVNPPPLRRRRANRLRLKLLENLRQSPPQTIPASELASVEGVPQRGGDGPSMEEELQVEGHGGFGESRPSLRTDVEKGDIFGGFLVCLLFLLGFIAFAAWFFDDSRVSGDSSGKNSPHTVGEEKEGQITVGEGAGEFQRLVSTIKAMAKEARAIEVSKAHENRLDEEKRIVSSETGKRLARVHGRTRMEIDGDKLPKSPKNEMGSSVESTSRKVVLSSGSSSSTDGNLSTLSKVHPGNASQQNYPTNTAKYSASSNEDRLWWLTLSHVLAIFLHRGSARTQFRGLYTLKHESESDKGSNTSYTVVFQDRADATNFCYLLESFFENLEDFCADVIPMSTKELHDAVKSDGLQVIVVRKGQLRLYAGQPLAEAEMQLSSILD